MAEQRDNPLVMYSEFVNGRPWDFSPIVPLQRARTRSIDDFPVIVAHAEERCRLLPPRLWTQSGLEAPDLQPGCFKADLILSFNGDPSGSNCSAAFSCSEAFSACPVAI